MILPLLLACGSEPADLPPSLLTGAPFAPDAPGSFDARLAGCTLTRSSATASDEETLRYDAEGRLTRGDEHSEDESGVSVTESALTWDGWCLASSVAVYTSPSMELTVEITSECDEHGNAVAEAIRVDGEDYATYDYVNTYDGDALVATEASLLYYGEYEGTLDATYGWSGDRWVEYDATYEIEGDVAAFHEEYEVDEDGQVLRQLQQDCSLVGAEECATTLDLQYSYADAHAVGSVRYELEQAEQEDGTWLEVSLATWESLLVSAPSGLPAFRATTSDGGTVVQDAFAVDCD